MGLKMSEILLIMGVLLLLFGASRLPQLGSSLGSAIRNFKRGFGGESESAADEKKAQGTGTLASSTTVEPGTSAKSPSHPG
jgi:TatA/E family protein of Tat protein translocase